MYPAADSFTHWGQVTHICVTNLTIIGPDNCLSPGQRQAIIWTNAGILLIGPWGTKFSEILSEIIKFSFNKMHLKMLSGKWRPFCLGLNVLTYMPTTLRSTPPPSGWPLRKRSAMIIVEVSQQAFLTMSGSYLFNMFVLFCNVNLM